MHYYFEYSEMKISLVISGALVFFYLYYYIAHSAYLKNLANKNSSGVKGKLQLFLLQKLTGFIFLGFLPAIIYVVFLNGSFSKFGLTLSHFSENYIILTGVAIVIATLLYLRHKKNPGQNTLQIKTDNWSSSMFLFNLFGWSIYLLAYEFLFRGILLFECYESFGFWPAVAINITIYSAIHMVNGKDQTIGALFFGGLACYLALTRETILIPLFMHIALSGFSDYFSIKLNPEIGFIKSVPVKTEKL